MSHIIEVKHLTKRFGEQIIFSDISLKFESGNIYGLVGRNGSGKTVFLKCICGFMEAENGEILQNGRRLKRDMEYLENMGFLIERPGFLEELSGYENLWYIASIHRLAGNEQIKKCMKQVRLDPEDKKRVGKYSMGMKQRLGVAQAIMENPDILILDEPMNGLDDSGVEFMRNLLLGLKQEGKLIFIASHYQEDIRLLCDHVYRFSEGNVQEQIQVSASVDLNVNSSKNTPCRIECLLEGRYIAKKMIEKISRRILQSFRNEVCTCSSIERTV